jgi:Cft2 family RNA processing exonuclease
MAANLRIKGLGGMDEVGASSAQIEIPSINRNLLLDSGIRMRNKNGPHGGKIRITEGHLPSDVRIDAILITHGHSDHAGAAPTNFLEILKASPNARIFMTKPTFYTAGNLWLNTSYLMEREKIVTSLEYEADFNRGMRMAIEQTQDHLVEKPGWVEVCPGVEAYFGPNGHIRGSAFIVLRTAGRQVMFTGDMSFYDSPTVKGMKVPEEFIDNLDAIFAEATYGDRVLRPRVEEEDRMAFLANDTISRNGICLAPACGVGSCPNVALAQYIRGVRPLYVDGMGKNMLDLCADPGRGYWCDLDHLSGIDLDSSAIRYVGSRDEREDLIYNSNGFSVVTTAGMMVEGSCAWQYATKNHFLGNGLNRLLITGFQAENTEGRELEEGMEQSRPIRLGGRLIRVEADVPPRLQLSSHADGTQIADMINTLRPKRVFVNHGNDNGREGLRHNLENLGFKGEIHLPNNGETIEF